jgi:hypothetical protein
MPQAVDTNTTRRALLRAAPVATAGVLAISRAVAAVASATADAELLDLGRRMDALTAEYWRIDALDAPWKEGYNALVDEYRLKFKEGIPPDSAGFIAKLKEIEDRHRHTSPSADDITDAMDEPSRKIMALPAFTLAGLAVKARATAFACSHFYREELHDADWDHQHVRTLIDAALVMAGQTPIGTEDGLYAPARPPEIDPAIAVAARFLATEKAYGKALERRAHNERLTGEDCADAAILDAVDAAMDAADAARRALFCAEPTTVLGVAALLGALAHNDDCESLIAMYVNADAGKTVNDFMRKLATVLRSVC